MDAQLAGQRILVTGSSRGLGAEFARCIAEAGGCVILHGRDQERLAAMKSSLPGAGHGMVSFDIRNIEETTRAVDGLELTGLVNNAGITDTKPIHEASEEDIRSVLETNLIGNLYVYKAVVPQFMARGGGVIVNVASVLGHRPLPQVGIYAASKAALIQATRSGALELARHQIRVNALCPGYVKTDINRDFLESPAADGLRKKILLRRFAEASELRPALMMMLDPSNSYMTGTTITIDGGMEAGL